MALAIDALRFPSFAQRAMLLCSFAIFLFLISIFSHSLHLSATSFVCPTSWGFRQASPRRFSFGQWDEKLPHLKQPQPNSVWLKKHILV